MSQSTISRNSLRLKLRKKRQQLSPSQQLQNSITLTKHLSNNFKFRALQKVALYLSNDNEIDLTPLIKQLWKANVDCYLPVLDKQHNGHLIFLPYNKNQILIDNKFHIKEPLYQQDKAMQPKQLDFIFMPLVGFDKQLNRLGMGGGFYDRSLTEVNIAPAVNSKNKLTKPLLIGVAHSVQQANQIPTQAWDVKCHLLFTENGSIT